METTPAIRTVRNVYRPLAGRKRSAAKHTSQRTPVINGNGFLSHYFQPFWGINIPAWKQAEREFFNSLSRICLALNINNLRALGNKKATEKIKQKKTMTKCFQNSKLEIG